VDLIIDSLSARGIRFRRRGRAARRQFPLNFVHAFLVEREDQERHGVQQAAQARCDQKGQDNAEFGRVRLHGIFHITESSQEQRQEKTGNHDAGLDGKQRRRIDQPGRAPAELPFAVIRHVAIKGPGEGGNGAGAKLREGIEGKLEAKGIAERLTGKVQEKIGQVKKVLGQ